MHLSALRSLFVAASFLLPSVVGAQVPTTRPTPDQAQALLQARPDLVAQLRQRFATTIRLPGYSGANNDSAAVNTFVANNNTSPGVPTVSSAFNVPGGGGYVGGAACTAPPP